MWAQLSENALQLSFLLEEGDKKPVFEKKPLIWEEDMELHSKFLDRKVPIHVQIYSELRHYTE